MVMELAVPFLCSCLHTIVVKAAAWFAGLASCVDIIIIGTANAFNCHRWECLVLNSDVCICGNRESLNWLHLICSLVCCLLFFVCAISSLLNAYTFLHIALATECGI